MRSPGQEQQPGPAAKASGGQGTAVAAAKRSVARWLATACMTGGLFSLLAYSSSKVVPIGAALIERCDHPRPSETATQSCLLIRGLLAFWRSMMAVFFLRCPSRGNCFVRFKATIARPRAMLL